ncbi:mCG66648, partial [Mus musculus]
DDVAHEEPFGTEKQTVCPYVKPPRPPTHLALEAPGHEEIDQSGKARACLRIMSVKRCEENSWVPLHDSTRTQQRGSTD